MDSRIVIKARVRILTVPSLSLSGDRTGIIMAIDRNDPNQAYCVILDNGRFNQRYQVASGESLALLEDLGWVRHVEFIELASDEELLTHRSSLVRRLVKRETV